MKTRGLGKLFDYLIIPTFLLSPFLNMYILLLITKVDLDSPASITLAFFSIALTTIEMITLISFIESISTFECENCSHTFKKRHLIIEKVSTGWQEDFFLGTTKRTGIVKEKCPHCKIVIETHYNSQM